MKPRKRLYHQSLKMKSTDNRCSTSVSPTTEIKPLLNPDIQSQMFWNTKPTQELTQERGKKEQKITTELYCCFTHRKHLVDTIILRFLNNPHVQSIICVCFVLNQRISQSITNGKTLYKQCKSSLVVLQMTHYKTEIYVARGTPSGLCEFPLWLCFLGGLEQQKQECNAQHMILQL